MQLRERVVYPVSAPSILFVACLTVLALCLAGRWQPGLLRRTALAAGQGATGAAVYLPLVTSPPKPQTIHGAISHGEGQRDYILYVPASYRGRSPAPLIINYHAYSRDAAVQLGYGDFRAVAEQTGALILHPQAAAWQGITRWNVGGLYTHPTVNDVDFTAALIDAISASYEIDAARIYATGFSNGAYMSYLVACQLSDRIAAVAPVAGSMTPNMLDECAPGRPLPVLHVHGLDDNVVPFQGNPHSAAVPQTLGYWIAANDADPEPSIAARPDLDPGDGSTVEHIVYGGGEQAVTVELLRVTGGGHTWPGSAVPIPGTNYDIDASAEIWDFFARYDINGGLAAGDWSLVAGDW